MEACMVEVDVEGNPCRKKVEHELHFELEVPEAKRWNAEEPNLYEVHITLRKAEEICIRVIVQGRALPTAKYCGFQVTLVYRIYKDGLVLVEYVGEPYGRNFTTESLNLLLNIFCKM